MRWAARSGKIFALAWLILLYPAVGVIFHGGLPQSRVTPSVALLAVYVSVYGWYCLQGHRLPSPAIPLAVAAACSGLGYGVNHLSGALTLNVYLLPVLVAGYGLRPRLALPTIFAITALGLYDSLAPLHLQAGDMVALLAIFLPQMLLWGAGAMGLRYLLRVLAELRAARSRIAALAAGEERTRIARDLHDLLGQSLSLITLKGELALRQMPAGAAGTAEVKEMLTQSRDALRQVREAVSGYRQPTLATELTAARAALAAAGVELDVEQRLGALDRETEAALGWVIREATTNVIRHSGARRCSIVLGEDARGMRVDVINDGRVVAQPAPGNGLTGLSERVAGLGGSVEAAAADRGGFRLRVVLPGRPGPADAPA